MRRTFLVSFALAALVGSAAAGSGSYDVTTSMRNFSRMLRSSATTQSLPRFPESPRPGRTVVDYPPRKKPIPVDGVVKAIGKDDLVEISLGRDDGVREGHEYDLSRGDQDLARIVIRRIGPNSAVGQIIPKTKRGMIRTGDIVRQVR